MRYAFSSLFCECKWRKLFPRLSPDSPLTKSRLRPFFHVQVSKVSHLLTAGAIGTLCNPATGRLAFEDGLRPGSAPGFADMLI